MDGSVTLKDFLARGRAVAGHRPWPRHVLDEQAWGELVEQLAVCNWTLLGLWADGSEVHAAFRDEEAAEVAVASLATPERRFPALSPVRPSAGRLERTIHDLFGLVAEGAVDQRPWLDHGAWPQPTPLGLVRSTRTAPDAVNLTSSTTFPLNFSLRASSL